MPVRGRAVAGHFAVDLGAPRKGMRQFFQHHNPAAARDHKAVARRVIGPRGGGWGVVFGCSRLGWFKILENALGGLGPGLAGADQDRCGGCAKRTKK